MAAVSCGGHYRMLNQAERLLETNPAQADSLLRTIPVPEGRRMRALYAVLRTQADYKNYKDITDDALITDACKLFHMNGITVRLIKGDASNIKITYPSDLKKC